MPQSCRFLGVNSVTNIEPHKGDLPAPIIRIVVCFAKFTSLRLSESHHDATEGVKTYLKVELRAL
jgi:hypothetical protein